MIEGFSLQYYPPHYHAAWGAKVGWQVGYRIGDIWQVHLAEDERATMEKIEAAIRSQQLDGFTLFVHPGKGWQMSVRRQGENGWDVKLIPDEQAQTILSLLEASGHPSAPMKVKPLRDTDGMNDRVLTGLAAEETLETALMALTATIRTWVP